MQDDAERSPSRAASASAFTTRSHALHAASVFVWPREEYVSQPRAAPDLSARFAALSVNAPTDRVRLFGDPSTIRQAIAWSGYCVRSRSALAERRTDALRDGQVIFFFRYPRPARDRASHSGRAPVPASTPPTTRGARTSGVDDAGRRIRDWCYPRRSDFFPVMDGTRSAARVRLDEARSSYR